MVKIITAVLVTFTISGIFWYLIFRRREKRLLDRLQDMVDCARDGRLERTEISEEKYSALEDSLKRYLDDSLKTGENQVRQTEIIQELISDIAHQTLTPVANLKLYGELLKEENIGGTENEKEVTETILEQADKLDFLIQSLVKLSRLENGIIAVSPKNSSVRELLRGIREVYCAKAEEKKIVFTVSETDFWAFFDLKWSVEAVGNLVDNAIKYTPECGKVSIRAQQNTFFVQIDIADNGIGIAETEIPSIFERFYRSFAVADQPGVGIGLYLAREIIRAQKGYIKVSSAPGRGSVFSVFLPVQDTGSPKKPAQEISGGEAPE